MRRLLVAALAATVLVAGLAHPEATAASGPRTRVAIIVGPVGDLTPTYLHLAELAAAEAERAGATVARAYSPNATPANVLAAVEGAHIVIYFGHGYGHPSPYGPLNTARQNGWGLQGPRARGTHDDGLDGELAYYGEDWIVANARPAPGFVMIYSNVCYAPGASEGGHPPATEAVAVQRVANYSRNVFRMGGSAYFAIDFDRGAADVVRRLLASPHTPYGSHFAADTRFVPSALRRYTHPSIPGEVWVHRTKYTDGPPNYWYAFAGNPDRVPARAWDPIAPVATLASPAIDVRPDDDLRVSLSEPLDRAAEAAWELRDAGGETVAASVEVTADGTAVAIDPERLLELSAVYTLVAPTGLSDAAGNPMPPATWDIGTRWDADPITGALPVVLRPGTHQLVTLDETGDVTESHRLAVKADRWVSAVQRARPPGSAGWWYRLTGGGVEGWWVAETTISYAVGTFSAATYPEPAELELPPGRYEVTSLGDGVEVDRKVQVGVARRLEIDRRVVVDGQWWVRAAEAGGGIRAGEWVGVPPVPGLEVHGQRIAATVEREAPASLTLGLGDWVAVRFDALGRVVDRRPIAGGRTPALATSRSMTLSGTTFHVIDAGDLAGWAIRDDARHTLVLRDGMTVSAE